MMSFGGGRAGELLIGENINQLTDGANLLSFYYHQIILLTSPCHVLAINT